MSGLFKKYQTGVPNIQILQEYLCEVRNWALGIGHWAKQFRVSSAE
ncbi:MAG: hypothetical protein V7K41_05175 [Nostoc sp.]